MEQFQRNARIESAPFESESILFNPDTNQFVKLNQTTFVIWEKLDQKRSAAEIASALCNVFDGIEPDRAMTDVRKILDQMMQLGLVQGE